MIHVCSVELMEPPYELRIGFTNRKWRLINLEAHLWGEVFTPLLYLSLFNQVRVDSESGTITWPNGADFAPAFLYEQGMPIKHDIAS